jgi:hypothetical protein
MTIKPRLFVARFFKGFDEEFGGCYNLFCIFSGIRLISRQS